MIPTVSLRNRAPHEVQFYQDRRFLTGKVAQFVEDGLSRGERVLVILEEAPTAMLWEELETRGVDVGEARRSRRLVRQDAREIADRIVVDGAIDRHCFDGLVRTLVSEMFDEPETVRIYGEVVNILLKGGDAPAALELESLWNELIEGKSVKLLCGYDISGFTDPNRLHDVTRCHNAIHPAEPLADFDGIADPVLLLGELQHCDHLLESESRARRELEEERGHLARQAELLTSHLGRLQAVTAALSEAAAPDDVARAIVTELARVTEAERAFLALPIEDGRRLVLAGHVGLSEAALDEFHDFAVDAPLPAAAAFRTGRALWLESPAAIAASFQRVIVAGAEAIACLPLLLDRKRIGVVGFGYPGPREFTPSDRALLHDLCRQASLALDRSQLLQRAEQAHRAKDDLLAILGHELRNPLSPIVTSIQLIRMRGDEGSYGPELDVIERQVKNLVHLVDDFLDVSRITDGRVRLDPERVECAEIVALAVEHARPLIEQRSHRLAIHVPARGLPLRVDPARMAQALSNILINAAKYTAPGGSIAVDAVQDDAEIAIRIRDDGPGIPPELLPRIFDLFVHGHRAIERGESGLGMGLSVARSLVELHHGRISARSNPGEGSEFTVRLPSVPPTAVPLPARDSASASLGESVMNGRGRILIVDDNIDGANALADGLRQLGYSPMVAHDPASALVAAGSLYPDVALIDIGLPSIDGYELARELRLRDTLRGLRFIAITGYGSEADRGRSKDAGFEAHLVKPVELMMLDETLTALLQDSSSRSSRTAG